VNEADELGPNNSIAEYTTSGATVNTSLISGVSGPQDIGIAVSGLDLFVASGSTVGEYTTLGATVNASLISDLNTPQNLTVVAAPEPSTWALLLGELGLLAFWKILARRSRS
jgi:hypothetical protein